MNIKKGDQKDQIKTYCKKIIYIYSIIKLTIRPPFS